MADLDLASTFVDQCFSEMAQNYCSKDLSALLEHYAREPDLLVWHSEGETLTTAEQLSLHYQELFDQFDIDSVNFRVEKLFANQQQILSTSLWVLSTQRQIEDEVVFEDQSLRATHLFTNQKDRWLINHLHVSPMHVFSG
ncbi:nuclear transport factor 2 family protein [uncultured Endozoicomonas sp.]|uniref:nuclear transport factor 2 family protein n=1 Tax=uncultured Endozoicomonas sp. TaxID=432652 RepID=UPI002609A2EE|nr:nuclear transport factor 2 family protein [uncultured Endozoicomonas sp.]